MVYSHGKKVKDSSKTIAKVTDDFHQFICVGKSPTSSAP